MRIVGGSLRGRVLSDFKGEDIRPTADKVRESFFNILQFKIAGKSFLDLFCGTGAVGIESYSRGAAAVTFNDLSKKSLEVLNKNLTALKIKDQVTVNMGDGIAFLDHTTKKFDIIFIDPPYKSGLGELAVAKSLNALTGDGVVILEDEKEFVGDVCGLVVSDKRKYGRVHLTFFVKEK